MSTKTKIGELIRGAEVDYSIGNFYGARKIAKSVKTKTDVSPKEFSRAQEILRMTSIDPLVICAGLLAFILLITGAFLSAYK